MLPCEAIALCPLTPKPLPPQALEYCKSRRSLVSPNEGFWRVLCALEGSLGIAQRSNPNAISGFHGLDAPSSVVRLGSEVLGGKVPVQMLTLSDLKRHAQDVPGRDRDERSSKRPRTGGEGRDASDRGGNGDRHRHTDRHASSRPDVEEGPSSHQDTGSQHAAGWKLTFDVIKPEGQIGQLVIGPMKQHQRCVVGRVPSCDVTVEHLSISRMHAQLTVDDSGHFMVTDLGSGHGTKVDDTWIKANAPRELGEGSVLRFGASTRAYKVLSCKKL